MLFVRSCTVVSFEFVFGIERGLGRVCCELEIRLGRKREKIELVELGIFINRFKCT